MQYEASLVGTMWRQLCLHAMHPWHKTNIVCVLSLWELRHMRVEKNRISFYGFVRWNGHVFCHALCRTSTGGVSHNKARWKKSWECAVIYRCIVLHVRVITNATWLCVHTAQPGLSCAITILVYLSEQVNGLCPGAANACFCYAKYNLFPTWPT